MSTLEKEVSVLKEIVVEHSFKAILYDNGIVEVTWDSSVSLIEISHIVQVREVLLTLGGGKKVPVFFSIPNFLHISDEAKKYAASNESGMYTIANAILITNLGQKLVFNFFMKINKPHIPTRSFSARKEAFAWLLKMQH
jgi:hypothetical protein